MVVEILFQEVCGLYGDSQNAVYLQATLPDAQFIYTKLTDTPYFADHKPDLIYIGCMSDATQRRVIEKLKPLKDRVLYLIESGVPILATGNAGEIFVNEIQYVTEKQTISGLGIFDLSVKTDLFKRYNGMVLGQLEDMKIVGYKSQFSCCRGDFEHPFIQVSGGYGNDHDDPADKRSKLNGIP